MNKISAPTQVPFTDYLEHYQLHPLCERLPPMTDEEYAAFRDDIATHGVREPLILFERRILDGRHRWRAACELRLPVWVQEVDFSSKKAAMDWVISTNVHRRHLTIPQRAMLGVGLVETAHGGDRSQNGGKTRAEVAEQLKISTGSLDAAARLEKSGHTDLVEQVMAGELSLSAAMAAVDERQTKCRQQARTWMMSQTSQAEIDWGDRLDRLPLGDKDDKDDEKETVAPTAHIDDADIDKLVGTTGLSPEALYEVLDELAQDRAEFLNEILYDVLQIKNLQLDFSPGGPIHQQIKSEAAACNLSEGFARAACEAHRLVFAGLRKQVWLAEAWNRVSIECTVHTRGLARQSKAQQPSYHDVHGLRILPYAWTEPQLQTEQGEAIHWCLDLFERLDQGKITKDDLCKEALRRTNQIVDLVWAAPLDIQAVKPPGPAKRNRLLEAVLEQAEQEAYTEVVRPGWGQFLAACVEFRIHKLRDLHAQIEDRGYGLIQQYYLVESMAKYELRQNSDEGRQIVRDLIAAKFPQEHAAAQEMAQAEPDFTEAELMGEEGPIWEKHPHWQIRDPQTGQLRRRSYAEFCMLCDDQEKQIQALQNQIRSKERE